MKLIILLFCFDSVMVCFSCLPICGHVSYVLLKYLNGFLYVYFKHPYVANMSVIALYI